MMGLLETMLFVGLSSLAVGASRQAWRDREAYGFFRFFGFECLALLIAWNAGGWFHDPFSPPQVLSWTILLASTVLAAHGVHLLRGRGGARRRVMEETEALVEVGVYRYIRHPLYASLLFFGWGVFFKGLDWFSGVIALAATGFWIATARCEERFNAARFGEGYADYLKRTKMFIPFLL